MARFIHLAAAAAAGMAAMYYLDPAQGERRRASLCGFACACWRGRDERDRTARHDGEGDDLKGPGGGVGTGP
ncbi:hypothetical protein [Paraburkholderia sp. J41]|uniref:hypothetical protein n=1 Tax=Paraburkholderia sp. J41 TaxID=2805433 RepID=UPI002AC32979|nr:hypothetical protein [Paraburkholderia sp. J41]